MSVLLGLWLARPVTAFAPQQSTSEDYISSDITIKDNAIIRSPQTGTINKPLPNQAQIRLSTGRHPTRTEKTISVERLQVWLSDRESPLAPYASSILQSPHWSTIIGICTIEQYGCTRAPGSNYWGIMCRGKPCRYATPEEGVQAISDLLGIMEQKGRDTIEELNCYYVQPCSNNWLNTVIRTKNELESLQ